MKGREVPGKIAFEGLPGELKEDKAKLKELFCRGLRLRDQRQLEFRKEKIVDAKQSSVDFCSLHIH